MEVIIETESYYYWNQPCFGTRSSFTSYLELTLLWGSGGTPLLFKKDVRVEATVSGGKDYARWLCAHKVNREQKI